MVSWLLNSRAEPQCMDRIYRINWMGQVRLMGRVRLDTFDYLEGGRPPAAVFAITKEFQQSRVL